MKTSSQIIMCKSGAILIVTTLAIGAVLSAPQQQASTSSATKSGPQVSIQSSISKAATTSSATQPKLSPSQLSSAASISNGSPSLVDLKSASSSATNGNVNDEMDTFDGKNPFSDDSLWQIPVHLVPDLTSANGGNMQKSASEIQSVDEEDDDDYASPATSKMAQSSSASPTIISASTDLKTAAGYHYPTHGHGYGAHEAAPSHGSHYGGGADHYGKYFQYASVPYPHAWEFGYRRGNPYHTIERYEHGKGPHFQTKVKWSDKHGGYGVHVWDYNHDDHHSHHYGGHESHSPSHYGAHHGSAHHGYGHH